MATTLPQSALVDFIKNNHTEYYGKICELRGVVEGWLTYIPQTFSHYTRHTIGHSDEIISQISNLLFREERGATEPVVRLSGVEAYILVAAAYLHDAGMVTSDQEKAEILVSEEWGKWTTGEGGGASSWNEIKKLKEEAQTSGESPDSTRDFLIDVQLRFLIAEFVRSSHHLRAGNVIKVHHDQLGRVDFEDPMLREAISQVCVGHGLRLHELDDKKRFPDLRDIRGERVNLRFLAILLRLGDLLDMSIDRACPLLLNAASPLPPDSFPHWEQYSAITHRATSPLSIAIEAECPNQDIHRVLQDWCQWIVDEITHAKLVIPKCQRHSEWQVPDATIEGDNPTIQIIPATGADYIPSKWVLKFDQQAIFERLSESVYSEPLAFVRELIQNSLDAIRCRMYIDLAREGHPLPEYPTQADEEFRNRYNVKVDISSKSVLNPITGKNEIKAFLVIEDNGIGMDADIIEKYFLQVGRSYYMSDEFRRNFHFFPTSQFGIGFLSVFAVSDNVVVDTYKPTSESKNNDAIRIKLSGFRNYLLREKSVRQNAGTRIEILLRDEIHSGDLTNLITKICRKVEFPITIHDFGEETIVIAENPSIFTLEQASITNPELKFVVRSFPVDRPGIEGELYVLATVDSNGESWSNWDAHRESKNHPLAKESKLPKRIRCFQGILVDEDEHFRELIHRIDYRSNSFSTVLDRTSFRTGNDNEIPAKTEIESRWGEILTEHLAAVPLANSSSGWKYRQKFVGALPLRDYWLSAEKTIPVYIHGAVKLESLPTLLELDDIYVVMSMGTIKDPPTDTDLKVSELLFEEMGLYDLCLNATDLNDFSQQHLYAIFNSRIVSGMSRPNEKIAVLKWTKSDIRDSSFNRFSSFIRLMIMDFEKSDSLLFVTHSCYLPRVGSILFNQNHAFGKWMKRVKEACLGEEFGLSRVHFEKLMNRFEAFFINSSDQELFTYISNWKDIPDLPSDLYPPQIDITEELRESRERIFSR